MRTDDLLQHHERDWRAGTNHPFLHGVRDGTLPDGTFESWLVQDYLFVADGLTFQSRLLARSPRQDQSTLAGGLVALESELGWFEDHAAHRGLALDTPRHPTTAAYRDFMLGLEEEPYPAALTGLWALEQTYLEAWRTAAPGHPEYRDFVEHWTTPEFAAYVASLKTAADRALSAAIPEEEPRIEAAFLETVQLEREFWEMALHGETGGGDG